MEPSPQLPDWLAEQSRRNLQSRGGWDSFASHRQQVTNLLATAARDRDKPALCLLGAGNCNDVDLPSLLNVYDQIHLVDCDPEALTAGVRTQGRADHSRLILRGGIDLLGLTQTPSQLPVAEALEAVANHRPLQNLPPCDTIASLCILSQLIEQAVTIRGPHQPPPLALIQAVRRHHLELMVDSLKLGGFGLLVSDVVSSATAPQLQMLGESELAAFLATCIKDRNFFTGLNPAAILDLLTLDPWFAARLSNAEPVGPWKWELGPRTFAVYGIRFRRRIES